MDCRTKTFLCRFIVGNDLTKCYCKSCTHTPAETYTDYFRLSAEAHLIVGWRNREQQNEYLAGIAVKRGKQAEIDLRNEMNKQINLKKVTA